MSDGSGWTPPVDPAAGGQPAWTPPPGGPPPPPPGGHWGTPPGAPPPGQLGAPRWGDQNAPWGAPPVARPGVIPLRPLALGEVLDGAFTVIRHYPKVTLGMSAVVVLATQLVNFLLTWSEFQGAFEPTSGFGLTGARIGTWLVGEFGTLLLAGLLAPVMAQAVLGRPATFRTSWERVRRVLPALLVVTLVASALPFLGLLLLVIPGLFLWGVVGLATPALVMEQTGIGGALRRAWRLAVPDFWRMWGTRALAFLISAILGMIIALPAAFVGGFVWSRSEFDEEGSIAFIVIVMLASIIASIITTPFIAGVLALLYIDRRMRAEGLDVTLAQTAAAQSAGEGGYGGGPGSSPGWPPEGQR